jgi:hypothetical protein
VGFIWRKYLTELEVWIRRADIVERRSEYPVKMMCYWEEGRRIFYVDET